MPESSGTDKPDEIRDWLVVFTSSDKEDLTHALRPGFAHCLAIGYSPRTGTWVLVNYGLSTFSCEAMSWSQCRVTLGHYLDRGATVLRVQGEREGVEYPSLRLPVLYCVEVIKHLLGIPGRWILTPYQLYKALLKRGATVVHHGLSDQRTEEGGGASRGNGAATATADGHNAGAVRATIRHVRQ